MASYSEGNLAEKSLKDEEKAIPVKDVEITKMDSVPGLAGFLRKITSMGVELRGSSPIPEKERTNTRTINLFTMWFTMSINLLP